MFALTSTWLTVVMAVCRYIVVCRPLHARGYIGLRRTRWSIIAAFVFSGFVNVPRLLRFTITAKHCSQLGPRFYHSPSFASQVISMPLPRQPPSCHFVRLIG